MQKINLKEATTVVQKGAGFKKYANPPAKVRSGYQLRNETDLQHL